MNVKRCKNHIELTYSNYILVVFADGTIFEGIYTNTGIRFTLTEEECNFVDVLWKLFIFDKSVKKLLTNNRK